MKNWYGRPISPKFETGKKEQNSPTVCRLFKLYQAVSTLQATEVLNFIFVWALKLHTAQGLSLTFFSRPRSRPKTSGLKNKNRTLKMHLRTVSRPRHVSGLPIPVIMVAVGITGCNILQICIKKRNSHACMFITSRGV